MFRLLPLLLLAPLVLLAEDRKADESFKSLFDGKTLTGWVPVNAAADTFHVKDGHLVTTGKPTGLLRSARRYENFVFECEWMHVVPKGNSGIFVWADPLPALGSAFTRAIEVQVLDGLETKNYTSHGDVFAIWGATFVPDREHPSKWMRCLPSERRARPAGQWNHYRIECNDGSIKLSVNGKEVSGGTKSTPRMGYICIEAEGSECRYKNLRIKELPSTKPTEKETCPEAQGHVSLFSGLDLKGWTGSGIADAWKTESGPNLLKATGKTAASLQGVPIWLDRKLTNFELIVDCNAAKGTTPLLLLGKSAYSLRGTDGKWSRFSINYTDGKSTITRDGKPHLSLLAESVHTLAGEPKGTVGLMANGPASFCNLFIREFK